MNFTYVAAVPQNWRDHNISSAKQFTCKVLLLLLKSELACACHGNLALAE